MCYGNQQPCSGGHGVVAMPMAAARGAMDIWWGWAVCWEPVRFRTSATVFTSWSDRAGGKTRPPLTLAAPTASAKHHNVSLWTLIGEKSANPYDLSPTFSSPMLMCFLKLFMCLFVISPVALVRLTGQILTVMHKGTLLISTLSKTWISDTCYLT